MAIGTGVYRRLGAEHKAAKEVADAAAKQRKKESKLGGLMSILSPLAALGSKGIIHGLLGLGSGGILTPLLLGLTSAGLKGGTEKLARDAGMGADTDEIAKASTSKYGYGREDAEEIAELMQEGIDERSAFNPESLGAEIGLQYVSALTPKIGEAGEIQGTELGKNLMPGGEGKFSWLGDRSQTGFFGTGVKDVPSVLNVEKLEGGFGGGKALKRMMASFMSDEKLKEKFGIEEAPVKPAVPIYEEGGQVPTIADFFDMQGKTLGGSNKKSLSEMLGRR